MNIEPLIYAEVYFDDVVYAEINFSNKLEDQRFLPDLLELKTSRGEIPS
jgi:hypothetical protein